MKIKKQTISKKTMPSRRNAVASRHQEQGSSTKITTTPLMKSVFENFFEDQIKGNRTISNKQCRVCRKCQLPDCGICNSCKAMAKFGGPSKAKSLICEKKRCLKLLEANEDVGKVDRFDKPPRKIEFRWVGEPVGVQSATSYYDAGKFGKSVYVIGDYVVINPGIEGILSHIGQIQYFFESACKRPMVHVRLFCRGTDTILGESADPRELFVTDACSEFYYFQVVKKANVAHRKSSRNWGKSCSSANQGHHDIGVTYFYSKKYDKTSGRFSDCLETPSDGTFDYCVSCKTRAEKRIFNTPVNVKTFIRWRGEEYRVGSSVFLDPITYNFDFPKPELLPEWSSYKEDLHSEYYRVDFEREEPVVFEKPFCIGLIDELLSSRNSKQLTIKVRIFFRAENTRDGRFLQLFKDINAVYWSSEVITTSFENVRGKCFLTYVDDCVWGEEWSKQGPYRFYYSEGYSSKVSDYVPIPARSKTIKDRDAPKWPLLQTPLNCMDVFAGCGGLSEGFRQVGLSRTKWAIEKDGPAAQSFKMNHSGCQVITDDCNKILQRLLNGEGSQLGLPVSGEVDIIAGGPPCQGFSIMNRFSDRSPSVFSNSLVVTYLSFCEYYKPKYFIMENVASMIRGKHKILLKLILKALLAMDYQVTCGILQAGNYGVPQTRKRFILIAAAPGYLLPTFPDPITTFHRTDTVADSLSFKIDDKDFCNDFRWVTSAPFRAMTVADAIMDLPCTVTSNARVGYEGPALATYQKMMRNSKMQTVTDHNCKKLQPMDSFRISLIPRLPGADWRYLPNKTGKLKNSIVYGKILYSYMTKVQNSKDPPRGVCPCAVGEECDSSTREVLTVIPWWLPHTADTNNQWAGVYGRLSFDGYFRTSLTNPNPTAKQGRVLHPEADRVISVREAARSQGFPDSYVFYGNITEKYRQIGNAVPPPLAAAIGREIQKANMSSNAFDHGL